MGQTKTTSERIYSMSSPDVIQKSNLSSVLISASVFMFGVLLFLFIWKQEDSSSFISMTLFTIGIICFLWSIYRIFWQSKEWVYLKTGSSIREGSCFFDNENLLDLINCFDENSIQNSKVICAKKSGNVRLDYMLSKDHKFAAVQLFHFIPYTYEPASRIFYLTGKDAEEFAIKLINSKF